MPTTDLTPPRLAVGSHSYTRAYGCAMNVLSWENGDTRISDMPSCTAALLAKMIHQVNDSYCTHTDEQFRSLDTTTVSFLCAQCSVDVLDLAHRTVRRMASRAASGSRRLIELTTDTCSFKERGRAFGRSKTRDKTFSSWPRIIDTKSTIRKFSDASASVT